MIQYKKRNSLNIISEKLTHEPYLIINIFFTGVILLVLAYSGIFSSEKDNYPIACIHEKLTGEPCFSCGLSHSFSLIVRGRFAEAYQWNLYGMRVFIFFAGQLILRIAFSALYLKNPDTRKQLLISDCIGSGMLFLIAFLPFLESTFSNILRLIG